MIAHTTDEMMCATWRVDAIDFGTMALALDPVWLEYVASQLGRATAVRYALSAAATDAPDEVRGMLGLMFRRDPRETYWREGWT